MTVREAFAKAGYPVPNGATLSFDFYEGDWIAVVVKRRFKTRLPKTIEFTWGEFPSSGWGCEYASNFDHRIDLSNLPARDAIYALPKVVRDVVMDKVPE